MKKFLSIFASIALLAGGFMFTGCGDEVTEVLAGPTNTWCKMPVTYKNSDEATESANLYAYFYYATSDKTIGKADLKEGLNVVITGQESTNSLISQLTSSTFILKSFAKDTDTTVSDSSSDTDVIKVNGSLAKWSAIYWAKDELRKAENKSTTAPTAVQSGTNLGEGISLENFSWKRILANYLLSILDA